MEGKPGQDIEPGAVLPSKNFWQSCQNSDPQARAGPAEHSERGLCDRGAKILLVLLLNLIGTCGQWLLAVLDSTMVDVLCLGRKSWLAQRKASWERKKYMRMEANQDKSKALCFSWPLSSPRGKTGVSKDGNQQARVAEWNLKCPVVPSSFFCLRQKPLYVTRAWVSCGDGVKKQHW